MMKIEFPVFKTRVQGVDRKFDLTTVAGRKEYFQAKAGLEIAKIKDYLDKGGTFVAYLLGKKNSGKGTYSKLFAEAIQTDRVAHISIGDLVRSVNEEAKDPSKKKELITWLEKNYRGYGDPEEGINILLSRDVSKLLPTELILALTKREIAKHPRKAIFLDGFPRQLDQISYSLYFRDLIDYRQDPDFFVLIDVSASIIDERIKYRRICPACKTPRNLKLLRTSKVQFNKNKKEYELICDNPECTGGNPVMVQKEGDNLGIEAIRDRIEADDTLVEKAFGLYGIPKVLLRNSVPLDMVKDMVDDYELTPEYVYEEQGDGTVKVTEKPWTIIDDRGLVSNSLMPAPVALSLIKQMSDVLGL